MGSPAVGVSDLSGVSATSSQRPQRGVTRCWVGNNRPAPGFQKCTLRAPRGSRRERLCADGTGRGRLAFRPQTRKCHLLHLQQPCTPTSPRHPPTHTSQRLVCHCTEISMLFRGHPAATQDAPDKQTHEVLPPAGPGAGDPWGRPQRAAPGFVPHVLWTGHLPLRLPAARDGTRVPSAGAEP